MTDAEWPILVQRAIDELEAGMRKILEEKSALDRQYASLYAVWYKMKIERGEIV